METAWAENLLYSQSFKVCATHIAVIPVSAWDLTNAVNISMDDTAFYEFSQGIS